MAMVDASRVAEHLGVTRGYVYEHAVELGARRLGSGPKARLRFDLAEVDSRLSACSSGRGAGEALKGGAKPVRGRSRSAGFGPRVELLPVHGGFGPTDAVSEAA